jgi:quercetin dioxygenase-like cupin family protein
MHVTTLPPGGAPHAPHRHPWEEILVVQRGQLDVLQANVTRRARAGAVIYQASNELHGITNPGPDSATYVVIRIDPHDLPPGAARSP